METILVKVNTALNDLSVSLENMVDCVLRAAPRWFYSGSMAACSSRWNWYVVITEARKDYLGHPKAGSQREPWGTFNSDTHCLPSSHSPPYFSSSQQYPLSFPRQKPQNYPWFFLLPNHTSKESPSTADVKSNVVFCFVVKSLNKCFLVEKLSSGWKDKRGGENHSWSHY